MSAGEQLSAIDRYLDKNWLDEDFPLGDVWKELSQRDKLLSIARKMPSWIGGEWANELSELIKEIEGAISEIEGAE